MASHPITAWRGANICPESSAPWRRTWCCLFANLKRFGLGVYHGFRKKHIQAYLDEFTFRWNRKRSFETAWSELLGIGLRIPPMDYWKLIGRPSPNRARQIAV
jgi:hypothetical protein